MASSQTISEGKRAAARWKVSLVEGGYLAFSPMSERTCAQIPLEVAPDGISERFASLVDVDWGDWGTSSRASLKDGEKFFPENRGKRYTSPAVEHLHRNDPCPVLFDAPFYETPPMIDLPRIPELLEFARVHGPLFDHRDCRDEGGVLVEDVEEWLRAALMLRLAIEVRDVSTGKAPSRNLTGFVRFRIAGELGRGSRNEVLVLAGGKPTGPYRDFLSLDENEYGRVFFEKGLDGATLSSAWLCPGEGGLSEDLYRSLAERRLLRFGEWDSWPFALSKIDEKYEHYNETDVEMPWPLLRLKAESCYFEPEDKHTDYHGPEDYDARSDCRFARNVMLGEVHRLLVDLHVRNVGFRWFDDRYELGCSSLLERIWHDHALSSSPSKLRICERCGNVYVYEKETKAGSKWCCAACDRIARSDRDEARKAAARMVGAICEKASSAEEAYADLLEKMMEDIHVNGRNLYRFEKDWLKLVDGEFARRSAVRGGSGSDAGSSSVDVTAENGR